MPTGLTDMVDRDPKMTVQQWVLQGLARQFGVLATLRDSRMDMTVAEIRQSLKEDDSASYHRYELVKARIEKQTLLKYTALDWAQRHDEALAEIRRLNKKSARAAAAMKKRHDEVRTSLEKLLVESESPTTKNIAQFGIDQLNLVESDCQPYVKDEPSLAQYKKDTIHSAEWNISYEEKELADAEKRRRERIDVYDALVSDVERVLGKEEAKP